jgi:hypothetical protein
MKEQQIKGTLVNFFRNGTDGDYLDALNYAIKEIQQVKNCSIPDVTQQRELLVKFKDWFNKENEGSGCDWIDWEEINEFLELNE